MEENGGGSGERELLSSAVQGDLEAAGRLFELQRQWLTRYTLRLTSTASWLALDPNDLVQATFSRAIPAIMTFEPRGPDPMAGFRNWLIHILTNLFRDEFRKKRSNYLRLEADALASDDDDRSMDTLRDPSGTTPSRLVSEAEALAQLRLCSNAIDSPLLQAFYFERQTLEQISKATGAEVGSLKGQLARLRQSLRDCMGRSSLWQIPKSKKKRADV